MGEWNPGDLFVCAVLQNPFLCCCTPTVLKYFALHLFVLSNDTLLFATPIQHITWQEVRLKSRNFKNVFMLSKGAATLSSKKLPIHNVLEKKFHIFFKRIKLGSSKWNNG